MVTTSTINKEMMEILRPDEDLMFLREGFDTPGIRREFTQVTSLSPGQRYVKQGNASFIHPDSDMPTGPTSEGESSGNVEIIHETGVDAELPRYTNGFTHELEDDDVDPSYVNRLMQVVMELFDVQADLAFMLGLEDEYGNTVLQDIFGWLDTAIPEDNVIDCSDYDVESDLNGIPANILKREVYSKVSGRYVFNQWDLAVAKHPVWAWWNELGTWDGIPSAEKSQWELMQAGNDTDSVGVNRRITVPYEMGFRAPSNMDEKLMWDIDTIDEDTMYIIPNHGGDFYELYEQGAPDGPRALDKEGWRERVEYKWRGGHTYGMSHLTGSEAVDTFRLDNVSALFDGTGVDPDE